MKTVSIDGSIPGTPFLEHSEHTPHRILFDFLGVLNSSFLSSGIGFLKRKMRQEASQKWSSFFYHLSRKVSLVRYIILHRISCPLCGYSSGPPPKTEMFGDHLSKSIGEYTLPCDVFRSEKEGLQITSNDDVKFPSGHFLYMSIRRYILRRFQRDKGIYRETL